MHNRLILLSCAVTILVGLSACKKFSGNSDNGIVIKIDQGKGQPLATVGNITLTLEEVSKDFADRQGAFRGAPDLNTERKRKEFVESEVIQSALFQEAVANNYFNDPEVKRDIKKIVVQKLMRDKLDNIQNTYQANESELKDHYDKNQNLYNRKEGVKVVYISVPFGENQNEAKKIADNIQKEAQATVKYANKKEFARLALKEANQNLAKIKSTMESNETGYLEEAEFNQKFGANNFNTVKSLATVGDIAPVLTSSNSYFIVMKSGARKELKESFEEAKPKIIKRVAFEKRGTFYTNYIEELKKKYNIKIFEERIAELGKDIKPMQNPPHAEAKQHIEQKEDMAAQEE